MKRLILATAGVAVVAFVAATLGSAQTHGHDRGSRGPRPRRRCCRSCPPTSRAASGSSSASSATRRRSATSTSGARTPASTSRSPGGSPATRSAREQRLTFVCAPTAVARAAADERPRRSSSSRRSRYTARPRHADRLLAGVLQGDRPPARQERLADPDASRDISGKRVATTSGSIYDRWMKRCFTEHEVRRRRTASRTPCSPSTRAAPTPSCSTTRRSR